MAVINPPGWLQNAGATHTAEEQRNWASLLLAGTGGSGSLLPLGGVHPTLGFELVTTQTGSPSMAVIVRSGHAVIPGSEGAKQGCYFVMNDADVTLSISAAHATLPRIDSVVFKVQDSQYSGVTNASSLVVVTGTPAGSPAAPTLPANAIEISRVAVGAAVTSITNANITDRRRYYAGLGGVISCTSTTRPAAPTAMAGQLIFETNTNQLMITPDDGTTWLIVWTSVWTPYTPIWTCYQIPVTPNPSIGNGTLTGKYRQIGKTVDVAISLGVGSTTNFSTNFWQFTLPPGLPCTSAGGDGNTGTAMAYDNSNNGPFAGSVHISSTTTLTPGGPGFWLANNPFVFTYPDQINMAITYETP